jgi:hypothetical protein
MTRFVALAICFLAFGCTDSDVEMPSTDAQRMSMIVSHAQKQASDPRHRELLAQGKVFVNLEGLDVPCVGVSVPHDSNMNRIHVSFTKDWFHSHSDDEIAEAMLEDLQRALADSTSDE